MKKIALRILLIIMMLAAIVSCSKKEKAEKSNKEEPINNTASTETVDETDRSGIDYTPLERGDKITLTTDGQLHEDKLLNKTFEYIDGNGSFEIKKDAQGYELTNYYYYVDDEEKEDYEEKEEIVKERLKVYKNSILLSKNYGYAYDTKYKIVVVVDPETMMIVKPAEIPWNSGV